MLDGAPIVAIVTGIQRPSANVKTGKMVQLWIMRRDLPPVEALRAGADVSVCGGCPLRGDGTGKGRACYVQLERAPLTVWRAYKRGVYPKVSASDARQVLAGRAVRLGAYGDPAALPLALVRELVADARMWTGYSHQWRDCDPAWAGLVMASVESLTGMEQAHAMGYRTFRVAGADEPMAGTGEVECAATRERNPLQCDSCGMCAGTRQGATPGAVSIAIRAHGAGARFV